MLITCRSILQQNTFSVWRSSFNAVRCSAVPKNHRVQQNVQLHCWQPPSPPACQSPFVSHQTLHNHQQWRGKSKKTDKRPSAEELEDDEPHDDTEDAYEEMVGDKHSRTIRVTVNSMRADLLLKAGLGIARNKVEALFYDSKIRVNSKKLLKKSAQLNVDDEIDVVRGPSPTNPEHLVVSRVEIVSVTPRTESLSVVLRRHKSMIIENYSEKYDGSHKN